MEESDIRFFPVLSRWEVILRNTGNVSLRAYKSTVIKMPHKTVRPGSERLIQVKIRDAQILRNQKCRSSHNRRHDLSAVDADASTAAAYSSSNPHFFIIGMVKVPVPITFAIALPLIEPNSPLATTAILAGPPTKRPNALEASLVK